MLTLHHSDSVSKICSHCSIVAHIITIFYIDLDDVFNFTSDTTVFLQTLFLDFYLLVLEMSTAVAFSSKFTIFGRDLWDHEPVNGC